MYYAVVQAQKGNIMSYMPKKEISSVTTAHTRKNCKKMKSQPWAHITLVYQPKKEISRHICSKRKSHLGGQKIHGKSQKYIINRTLLNIVENRCLINI